MSSSSSLQEGLPDGWPGFNESQHLAEATVDDHHHVCFDISVRTKVPDPLQIAVHRVCPAAIHSITVIQQ